MSGETFGHWLNRMLRERKISQTRLALELGVTRNTVSRWVTENRKPKAPTIEQIAVVLGVTVDEAMVAAGVLTGERAQVGPRAQLRDLLSVLPDEEVAIVLAFAEFRANQYRQAMRLASSII